MVRKIVKFIYINIIILFGTSLFYIVDVNAQEDIYRNDYLYDYWGNTYYSAPMYEQTKIVDGNSFIKNGVDLKKVSEMFFYNNRYYILDNEVGFEKIIVTDSQFNYIDTIDTFGDGDKFTEPKSLYIRNDIIYVADTGAERIVALNVNDYSLIKIIGRPSDVPGLAEKPVYKPLKIAVDKTNRIYVIVDGIFEGIVELDINGKFYGFKGVNKVNVNLLDLIWMKFMTEEQKKQLPKYLPTTFTNLDVDDNGFIYTTTKSDGSEPIKKINLKGEDVLKFDGNYRPQGDLEISDRYGRSIFVSVAINDYGVYAALDENFGRIFLYNENGSLLGIFGRDVLNGGGSEIMWKDDHLIVIDEKTNRIFSFKPTDYGQNILMATKHYHNGDIEEAAKYWEKVLDDNSYYELAYVGKGKINLRNHEYKQAMENFKLGNDKIYYSKAFEQYRNELIKTYLPYAFGLVVLGIATKSVLKLRKWRGSHNERF